MWMVIRLTDIAGQECVLQIDNAFGIVTFERARRRDIVVRVI